jgi:hypothetical protein
VSLCRVYIALVSCYIFSDGKEKREREKVSEASAIERIFL